MVLASLWSRAGAGHPPAYLLRLRGLVAFHVLLATLPAAICLLPVKFDFFQVWPFELLTWGPQWPALGQAALMGLWISLGMGSAVWRLVGAGLGCAYVAVWATLGAKFAFFSISEEASWADDLDTFVQTFFGTSVLVALFAAMFFVLRRWAGELWQTPEADPAPSSGRAACCILIAMVVVSLVTLPLAVMRGIPPDEGVTWQNVAVSTLSFAALVSDTFFAGWAALSPGRVRWRVSLVFLVATLFALDLAIVWREGWYAWWVLPSWVIILLSPIAVVAASLSAIRACGYRLAPRPGTGPQFSLRMLLAGVTVLCVGFGAVIVPAEKQRRAVAALQAAGLDVDYYYFEPGDAIAEIRDKSLTGLFTASLRGWLPRDYFERVEGVGTYYHGPEITDAHLAYLRDLHGLRDLDLAESKVTDAGLVHVRDMAGLELLFAHETAITDAGLRHLHGLASLRRLSLGSHLTDDGLAHLQGLRSFRGWMEGARQVTDAGLVRLQGMSSLEELHLEDMRVTGAGFAALHDLTGLRKLYLGGSAVTDDGLVHLQGLTGLEELYLEKTQVTGAGFAKLHGLTRLRYLYLSGASVTDDGLACLEGLTNLEALYLEYTGVTGAGFARLHGLTRLRKLYLDGTPLTDDAMTHLSWLTGLERLALDRTSITGPGLVHLQKLPSLKRLTLGCTWITDAGLAPLEGLKVNELYLADNCITDAGLAHLQHVKGVEQLWLNQTQITDAGLNHLRKLTRLRFLELETTNVTPQAVAKLKQLLPNCRIDGP